MAEVLILTGKIHQQDVLILEIETSCCSLATFGRRLLKLPPSLPMRLASHLAMTKEDCCFSSLLLPLGENRITRLLVRLAREPGHIEAMALQKLSTSKEEKGMHCSLRCPR